MRRGTGRLRLLRGRRRGRGAGRGRLRLARALALDVAGGGPFADDGGVAFEEVVHEGFEALADAHAGGDEFAEGVGGAGGLLAGGALCALRVLEVGDALVEGVLEIVLQAVLDEGVVQREDADRLDEGAGGAGEFGVVVAVGHPKAVHDLGALEVFGDGGGGAIPFAEVAGERVAQNAAARRADGSSAALLFGDFLADGDVERVEFAEFCAGFGFGFFLSVAVGGGVSDVGGVGFAEGGHVVEAVGAGEFAVIHGVVFLSSDYGRVKVDKGESASSIKQAAASNGNVAARRLHSVADTLQSVADTLQLGADTLKLAADTLKLVADTLNLGADTAHAGRRNAHFGNDTAHAGDGDAHG